MLLIARGVLGFLALFGNFYALHHLPLADATVIFQAVPLAVLPISYFLLQERYTVRQWSYFFLGLAGVALVLYSDISSAPSWLPALVALLSALITALAYTLVRTLSKTENNQVIIFYFAAISTLFSAPPALHTWHTLSWPLIALLLGIGGSATLAQIFLTMAYKAEKAAKVAALNYLAVPLAAFWGLILWHEIPSLNTIIGTAVILLAVLLLHFRA